MMANRKKIAYFTLGCKLNFSETSTISKDFILDFTTVDFKEIADVYVIHSCAVTTKAEKKTKAAVKQAYKQNPNAIIAVLGCFSQLKPDEVSKIDGVKVVLGTADKFNVYDYIKKATQENQVKTTERSDIQTFYPSYSIDDRTRSFFKIQDGCNNFCTYCTVAIARGKSRSNTIEKTLDVAKEIVQSHVKEIILTGVNIGDYGRGNNESLLDLLVGLDQLEGVDRYRISSIEPDLLTDDIISFVHASKRILPHFHIPLQSGSDHVLKAMGRHYTTDLFADRVTKIKTLMPDACIAMDVIVGFPGESDAHFLQTYEFIKSLDISYVHVFTYSERENTRAVTMENSVPIPKRTERSNQLHDLSNKKKFSFYLQQIGKQRSVLFEKSNEKGYLYGYTDNYIRVKTPYAEHLANDIKNVMLQKIDEDGVFLV